MKKKAIIIGAGPAGLTAAYELLTKSDIKPIIIEQTSHIGGISKTINFEGNRIDIGGHRFFSKSDKVIDWWLKFLPLEEVTEVDLTYQGSSKHFKAGENSSFSNNDSHKVMLVRNRLSRIYYGGNFYDYPITLNIGNLRKLGFSKVMRIGLTYLRSQVIPINPEKNLEDFYINRFGLELYETFFKNYTTKVWGQAPHELSSDWGAQRVQGLSLSEILKQSFKNIFQRNNSLDQKGVQKSLIQKFLYPKYGPGQLWEEVALKVQELGGEIIMDTKVLGLNHDNNFNILSLKIENKDGQVYTLDGDYFISTMPMRELLSGLNPKIDPSVLNVSDKLVYRDFITIGVLINKLHSTHKESLTDNWIYIHDPGVHVGRIQVFNNWSPHMVEDVNKIWLGLEYFCNEGDAFWNNSDANLLNIAKEELVKLKFTNSSDIEKGTVIRMPKAYPTYIGGYNNFDILRHHMDKYNNLFLVGRNGMHRYNNQDHSMLTAMAAVDLIISGNKEKDSIWSVNADEEYHETKK